MQLSFILLKKSLEVISSNIKAKKWCKIEIYNEVRNDMGNVYLYNAITRTAKYKHDKSNYNMQIICHIKKEDNADKSDLINMGIFKPKSGNAVKRLKMQ